MKYYRNPLCVSTMPDSRQLAGAGVDRAGR